MGTRRLVLLLSSFAVLAVLAGIFAPSSEAKLIRNREASPAVVADPSCCAPVCPTPCITYRHHRGRCNICCDPCLPPIQTVLHVQNPNCCVCPVEIPVCLPACCTGEPCVTSRCGLFGRGIVEYEWCCGYRVRVVFDRRGDVTVHTYGG